jgi:hypothetical protein
MNINFFNIKNKSFIKKIKIKIIKKFINKYKCTKGSNLRQNPQQNPTTAKAKSIRKAQQLAKTAQSRNSALSIT